MFFFIYLFCFSFELYSDWKTMRIRYILAVIFCWVGPVGPVGPGGPVRRGPLDPLGSDWSVGPIGPVGPVGPDDNLGQSGSPAV
jgi:hypothetical protein